MILCAFADGAGKRVGGRGFDHPGEKQEGSSHRRVVLGSGANRAIQTTQHPALAVGALERDDASGRH